MSSGNNTSGSSNRTFNDLGLDGRVVRALAESGFEAPFPIQEVAIPSILQGKDIVGQAHTGTGKTAAFSLPLLSMIKGDTRAPQALILVPTRELAMQVTAEISKFSKYTQTKAVPIYGGQGFGLQLEKLRRGAQIIVATPGRLIDHVKRGTIRLDSVRFVVLDEADRMMDMGFIDDIKFILSRMDRGNKDRRQTMLFSATMPAEILRLAKEHMREGRVQEIRLNRQEVTIKNIDQSYLLVSEQDKFGQLVGIIRRSGNSSNSNSTSQSNDKDQEQQKVIVFAATKSRTDRIARNLKGKGFRAAAIHGDLQQKERDSVMNRFRKGSESVLVATDIAARGIDVPAVGHVINYDVPADPDTYFHRIGRTARAGAQGKALSLVTPDRLSDFERIIRHTKIPVRRLNESMGVAIPVATHGHGGRNNMPSAASRKRRVFADQAASGGSGSRRGHGRSFFRKGRWQ
jgi:ATP-dependent RNA helicase DeaD